ncbi:putative uncharacterized protein DDB_G0272456 [Aphidius gifuensis]|uniref:putative uncharacterized protein DDB_G0272456 n=1 Tax=Aphidius gifuensis TaxID=684658 RepID=UPI001CDBCE40|nr:putative uncharacterized protein DDB_G0272456 [Aphidius gifuensis]
MNTLICVSKNLTLLLENKNNIKTIIMLIRKYCNENNNNNNINDNDNNVKSKRPLVKVTDIDSETDLLEEPTTCCMSGCTNCVWIEYADKLSEKLKNSNDDVQKIIMNKIQDPNMRAFLSMELKCRKFNK